MFSSATLAILIGGLVIGLLLGLTGGGGSILTVPLLVYAVGLQAKVAIATSLVIVGVASLAGLLAQSRRGNVDWRTGVVFGAAGMAGAPGLEELAGMDPRAAGGGAVLAPRR